MALSLLSLTRLAALTLAALACAAAPARAADDHEPNDTQRAATGPLAGGTTYSGDIASADDADWYVLFTSGPATVELIATSDTPKGCFGPEFFLYDAAGNRVAKAHPASGRSETASFAAPGRGRYLLRVTPYYIEPCPPEQTKYHFAVGPAAALTSTPPESAGTVAPPGGGTAGGATTAPPSGGKPPAGDGRHAAGGSSGSKQAGPLPSPALKLGAATLRGSMLRVSGRAAATAKGGRVRITVTRKAGRRTVTVRRTVRIGAGARWAAALKLPASLRRAGQVRVQVAFLADARHRGATVGKTVRRSS